MVKDSDIKLIGGALPSSMDLYCWLWHTQKSCHRNRPYSKTVQHNYLELSLPLAPDPDLIAVTNISRVRGCPFFHWKRTIMFTSCCHNYTQAEQTEHSSLSVQPTNTLISLRNRSVFDVFSQISIMNGLAKLSTTISQKYRWAEES